MTCWLSIFVGLFALCVRSYAAAVVNEQSPQFLYMELLRNTENLTALAENVTETMEIAGENSAQTPGKLLATSFKDISKSSP